MTKLQENNTWKTLVLFFLYGILYHSGLYEKNEVYIKKIKKFGVASIYRCSKKDSQKDESFKNRDFL